jgi:murein DD-endopeptidase MepM/ murein hydrolase activator NlpD
MRLPFNSNYLVTQVFGVNPAAYAQYGMKGHNGIDYGTPQGTTLVAAITGIVYAGYEAGGYGNYVFLRTEDGRLEVVTAHMSRVDVQTGQRVTEGQQIGLSGGAKGKPGSGNSSGPHVHFGVRPLPKQDNGYLGYEDPQIKLNAGGIMASQQIADALTIQLFYNNGLLRQPDGTEVQGWGGQTVEAVGRGVLGSGEHKQVIEDRNLGARARLENWEGQIASLKAQLADKGTKLEPGVYRVE